MNVASKSDAEVREGGVRVWLDLGNDVVAAVVVMGLVQTWLERNLSYRASSRNC